MHHHAQRQHSYPLSGTWVEILSAQIIGACRTVARPRIT
jgi:hypothetical protein